MEFLKNLKKLSLCYDGEKLDLNKYISEIKQNDNILTTVYIIPGGVKITNIAKKFTKQGAYEWVNYIENTADSESKIISELWDCVCAVDIGHEDEFIHSSKVAGQDEGTIVYAPNGSCCRFFEFYTEREREVFAHVRQRHIHVGDTWKYCASGGRSSEEQAPFFEVHHRGRGVIFAVGWTGQWNCHITRNEDDITFKTKIEDTHFKLLPGEKIRTSSVVVMPYECSKEEAHVKWRRLLKENFSHIGKDGSRKNAPLSFMVWGGSSTEDVLSDIRLVKENHIPFEYLWMDAGWYGIDTKPNISAFVDEWKKHTGDWRVSRYIHPNGLKDVSASAEEAGMKFLLWFEVERVNRSTPIALEHPEYMLENGDETRDLLLNLGNEDAWQYCYSLICDKIKELNIGCFRLDFNMSPLGYWRYKEENDRQGINEIKYINGLYKLFDCLLEKFPELIIDNCASGGRRIDIEMIRRSVPLWRSDFQCSKNCDVSANQTHHVTFNTWLPYSGSCSGDTADEYRMRSSYDSSLCVSANTFRNSIGKTETDVSEFLKKHLDEYLMLRPYFSEDFYPLTKVSEEVDVWAAMQFDRPDMGDGIVQVFKREDAPYETAVFGLFAIDRNKNYVFEDIDTGKKEYISGAQLCDKGFSVTIKEKRVAKIYLYKEV